MHITASKEFWEEVLRLHSVIMETMDEVAERGVEVVKLLASQDAESTHPQVRAIIKGVEDKHSLYVERGMGLTIAYGELVQAYGKEGDFYIRNWQQVLARNGRVDEQKIANEELLACMAQSMETMENTPYAIEMLVSAASISHFSQFLYYADLLNVYLQYPPKFRRALDAVGKMAKAAAMDFAGILFPFIGTVVATFETIFDLNEPRINKKIEELQQATGVFNRVADFGDQLAALLDYANSAEDVIRSADVTLKATHTSFALHATWLKAVLGNAERDDEGIS